MLELPEPARRLVTAGNVNVAVWLRNVGDVPVEVHTTRALGATISRGPVVVAGPGGMRSSARIVSLASGRARSYGL